MGPENLHFQQVSKLLLLLLEVRNHCLTGVAAEIQVRVRGPDVNWCAFFIHLEFHVYTLEPLGSLTP